MPASVPSVFHNSLPSAAVVALKYTKLPSELKSPGSELVFPGKMSLTRTVPAAVPSVMYISEPVAGVLPLKISLPASNPPASSNLISGDI